VVGHLVRTRPGAGSDRTDTGPGRSASRRG
jgi:hypothetical protein